MNDTDPAVSREAELPGRVHRLQRDSASPLADTKAPDGPIEERWDTGAGSRRSWSTRPTAASTP